MVLKRKLPSKLTQPNAGQNEAAQKTAEFIASAPFSTPSTSNTPTPNTPEPTSFSEPTPAVEPAMPQAEAAPATIAEPVPTLEDVAAPAAAMPAPAPSSAPQTGGFQRKKKKHQSFSSQAPAAATAATTTNSILYDEPTENDVDTSPLLNDETKVAAPKHFDGSDRVSTGLKDIRGEFKDPAEEETEAAFIAPPSETNSGFQMGNLPPLNLESSFNATPAPEAPIPTPSAPEEPNAPAAPAPMESTKTPMPTAEKAIPTAEKSTASAFNTWGEDVPQPTSLADAPTPEPMATPMPDMSTPKDATPSAEKSDFFANVTLETPDPIAPEMAGAAAGGMAAVGASKTPPPILPGSHTPELPGTLKSAIGSSPRASVGGALKFAVVAIVGLLGAVAYIVFSGDGGGKQEPAFVSLNQPAEDELLPPPALGSTPTVQTAATKPNETQPNNTIIDFVDVNAAEANAPITATDDDLPEEIGAVAKFQRAVERERALKEGRNVNALPDDESTVAQTEAQPEESFPTKAQIEAELAAYREALAETTIGKDLPKPGEFIGSGKVPAQNSGTTGGGGTPTLQAASIQGGDVAPTLAPPVLENPYNLPVIPQPGSVAAAKPVRTLEDFDLAAFEPDRDRVRIPKGVQPRLSAANFPELDVLSFVPERGIIATNRGREGVLLIGESIEGWELVSVYDDYAEFNNGTRKYTLVRQN